MRRPFENTYLVTQIFGVNPELYARFGLKGHNGYDYGLSAWTPVLAPHTGKILEATFDEFGYGNYVKIDNGVEGSVLAHLAKISVAVGQETAEGELIGYSGNTGNSTGQHLHWGYYRNPRDRTNGFAGFIDQDEYLKNTPSPVVDDDWKKSAFDRLINGLFKRKLLDTDASEEFKDKETLFLIGLDNLLEDNEAHHRGYEEFKARFANAEKDLLLKDNQIKLIKEQAESVLKKELADLRVECQKESDVTLEQKNRKIDELNQVLKNWVKVEKKLIETPLTDRFREKTLKEKLLGILEIIF